MAIIRGMSNGVLRVKAEVSNSSESRLVHEPLSSVPHLSSVPSPFISHPMFHILVDSLFSIEIRELRSIPLDLDFCKDDVQIAMNI